MARNARKNQDVPKEKPYRKAQVIQERPPERLLPRSQDRGSNAAIRTVIYIEVDDLPPAQVRVICSSYLKSVETGHPHFVVPLRKGKMLTEMEFETEFLETIKRICEVKNGEIAFKTGYHEIDIIRRRF